MWAGTVLRRKLTKFPRDCIASSVISFSHSLPLTWNALIKLLRSFRKLGEYDLPLPLLGYLFIDHYTGDSDVNSCEIWGQRIPERDRIEQTRRMLLGYCGGLFEPTQAEHFGYFRSEMILSFTHRSVPEFIESLDTKEKENHLRGFCIEDTASYLYLAYLWAKDTFPDGVHTLFGDEWMSGITRRLTMMRTDAKIGKVPFHFEEHLWSVLTRLGAKTSTEHDGYGEIGIRAVLNTAYYPIA